MEDSHSGQLHEFRKLDPARDSQVRILYPPLMIVIGLTGGIASGKTTVAKSLEKKGTHLINADVVAHKTYAKGTEGYEKVISAFGEEIIDQDRNIDRKKLGEIVFGNKEELSKLTNIVWPLTKERLKNILQELSETNIKIAVLEAAVLEEAGWDDLVDEIWRIETDDEITIQRLLIQGFSKEEAVKRLLLSSRSENQTVLIENNGGLKDLENKVDEVFNEFKIRRNL